jgi:isopentenyldiphosphate isomerase
MAGEMVDVVDEQDGVVATVTRAEMRARRLRHRCVSVVVRDGDGQVLVHRRSDAKDVWPGRWDLCVGGVVASGETYDEAAVRELGEEVGISGVPPALVWAGRYEDADVDELVRLYTVVWDGPISFVDAEVVEARWVPAAHVAALVEQQLFCPDSVAIALRTIV